MVRPLLIATLLPALLAACTPSGYPPVLPRDMDALEPPVRRLVERRVADVEAGPADAEAHALLGAAYHANGMLQAAAESFAQAAMLEDSEPLWPYYVARALHRLGRIDAARDRLEEALARDASCAPAHQLLGWLQLDVGETDAARNSFQRSRALAPESPEPLLGLATLALEEDGPAEARELAESALAKDSGDGHARYVLGRALVALGDVEAGREEMEAGKDAFTASMRTSFSTNISESTVNRASVLERVARMSTSGAERRALELVERLADDFPEDPIVHSMRGSVLELLGRAEDASEAYLQALQLDDSLSRTWKNLANLHLGVGNTRGARDAAQRALAIDDTLDQAWVVLSAVERRDGDFQGALRAAKRAIDLKPATASHHANLGDVYSIAGQTAAAQACYETAVELEPNDARLRLALASASIRLAQYDTARAALDRAAEIDPNVRGLAQLRQQLERESGR